ncbi:glycoside hydrolase family 89 protein [Phanerochaete sordida]|uniref:Glycoside hydrolase family 89 protein n=1 Tax=Phanerochaete sordida TaxID=48140 RepID=A0A9P3LBY7_9APHY|nr:glycoside hydrolase family 89 protein [Phanerochaete sordida]
MRVVSPLLLASVVSGATVAAFDAAGLQGIIERRLPQHAGKISFSSLQGGGDSFVVREGNSSGTVSVSCTSTSACARGLYTYLTEVGGVDIFWTGSRLHELQTPLPKVTSPITGASIVPYRYHFNTVTFGYTTAFWDFDQWSLLLDWLALRGVNLPLAWVGFESVLIPTLKEYGLSDAEIADFMSGPAFLPWNRFGNIQGSWAGPLPTQWVEDQAVLQKQILARMLELGMTPILPAFTGFVPRAMATHYPNASIADGSNWDGFPTVYTNDSFLDPAEPLFAQIQRTFLTKQQEAWGNITHFYTLDQYNENDPLSGDTAYLASVASGTLASLRAVDPAAVWVMQGWLFFAAEAFWTSERIEAYLGAVPEPDAMLVLDLYAEAQPQWNRTDSYYGKPWVWCQLHNLGGSLGLAGNLPHIFEGPVDALHANGSTMVGVGNTMEGQEPGNEIVYGALLDQAWSAAPLNVSDYVLKRATRRYLLKEVSPELEEAWSIIGTTIFSNQDPDTQMTIRSIIDLPPALSGLTNLTGVIPTKIPYDTNATLQPAVKLLWQAQQKTPSLRAAPEFAFDLVEFTRQLLANRFLELYSALVGVQSSAVSTAHDVATAGAPLVALLADLEALLQTNEQYLFSAWVRDATRWAHGNATYAAYLEYEARNQLTLWGPDGQIDDYASKQWAGLVGGYYAVRWQAFVDALVDAKTTGQAFNATDFSGKMLQLGKTFDTQRWGTQPNETWGTKGDSFEVVGSILERWT